MKKLVLITVLCIAITAGATSPELYPTIHCVGIRLSYTGNPQHSVEYRLAGTSSWKVGHHLTAITSNRLAGSLLWLEPNSLYEVKITIGNEVFTGTVTTRADSPPASVGATYYVATNGNDTNPGTAISPFATIGKAASVVQAGDTVIVRSGTYHEAITMTASGTLANPIHFKSETPLGAVIDGSGSTTVPIVKCLGVSNIILEGFTLQNAGDAVVLNNASGCWITGNEINCTDEGVHLLQNTSNNNVVQYNQIRDTTPGGGSSGGNSGVELEGGRGNIIRYNDVNGFSNGISAGHLFDAGLIDDESINPDIDVYGNVVYNIGDDALEPEGCCINNRLWDNQMYGSFVAISIAPIGVGPAYVIRNTSFESTPIKFHLTMGCGPTYVYHNTSFKGSLGGYGLKTHNLGSGNHDVVFRNNIFHSSDSYVLYGAGGDLDYDLYFFTGSTLPFQWDTDYYATLEAFQAGTGEEPHGLLTDPLLVDAWGQDFSLQPASPARNAGVYIPGINDDYKGLAPDMGVFEFVENGRPVVYAGSDQLVTFPNSANLDGTVTDDGLPNPPSAVTVTWTKQSGPGTVTFGNIHAVDTTASFSVKGVYVLRLTASDSELLAYDELTVTVGNNPPSVNAGLDQQINLPANANLDGTVTDDGLPIPPGAVTATWTKQSGPGTVTFGNIHAVDTTASFSTGGTYVLRLTADDGELQAYDELTITVSTVVNTAPSVNAGLDQQITLPNPANLDGTVTDDGLPNPPGAVTVTWTKQSGPGTVTFGNIHAVDTTASFSAAGAYVLRLTANDSVLQAYDEVTITVNPATTTFYSSSTQDGYLRESTETSGVGGYANTANAFQVGDTATRQQLIGLVSFDTSSISDGATITAVTLTVTRSNVAGTPTSLGAITIDIKNGFYGSDSVLRAADFQAASSATNVATLPYPTSGTPVSCSLNSAGLAQINKTGLTQMKIRFTLDDDNDSTADYLSIYDGKTQATAPKLVVTWQ